MSDIRDYLNTESDPDLLYLIACDPGKSSGLSFFSIDSKFTSPNLISSAEEDYMGFAPTIREFIDWVGDTSRISVVCERFLITTDTGKKKDVNYSLEMIGFLKLIMIDYEMSVETDFHLQTPANAKTMFPNPALKALGFWHVGGAGHAMDSIRHGLLRLVKVGWNPVGLLDD